MRIAFYSCQHYESGFFNVQRAIAREKDIDLVVCLGDYIYEYSNNEGVRLDRSGDNKDGDVQLVREYRQKYELYKRDKDLKAMHAAHPFICVWDDHEVEDNYADGQASSAQDDSNKTNLRNYPRRVSFAQRKENGYRAFFNYNPRLRFKGDRSRIYEDYRLGGMVDLMLTDERQYRDRQPCNDAILTPCPSANDPRTLLGAKQKEWLVSSLKASPATWKIWGTELMLMGRGWAHFPRTSAWWTPGTATATSAGRSLTSSSTTASPTWRRSPATSTVSSPGPPITPATRPARVAPGATRVRRGLCHLAGPARSDRLPAGDAGSIRRADSTPTSTSTSSPSEATDCSKRARASSPASSRRSTR